MKLSTASALYLILGAVLAMIAFAALLEPPRPATGRRPHRIGYVLTVLAALAWTACFGAYMRDRAIGTHLALFFALLVPAVAGAIRPDKRQYFVSLVFLCIALVFGVPALPRLVDRVRPSRASASITQIGAAMVELNERIQTTGNMRRKLVAQVRNLRRLVAARQHEEFEDIEDDAEGYRLLGGLALQQEVLARTEDHLLLLHDDKNALVSEHRRLRRLPLEGREDAESSITIAALSAFMENTRIPPWEEAKGASPSEVSRDYMRRLFENGLR